MFNSYLLFFFAALGSFNGLALFCYLLWRKPVTPVQRWLAALVLMLSLRTGKSVVFFFWPEIPKPYLQLGLTACLLIGVCLLGFVRAWTDPVGLRTRRDSVYLIAVLALAFAFGWAYPYGEHLSLWRGPVIHVIYLSWLICVLLAAAIFLRSMRGAQATQSALSKGQVASVITGVALIWLAYASVGFTSYIVGALTFSVLLYLSVMVAFAQRTRALTNPIALEPEPAKPYQDRKIDQNEAETALHALHALMADEQLYKSAGLTLSKVARRLNVPPARLSQLLNDNHKTPFKQYLTQLRIDAAKKLMSAANPIPMEQVAEAAGFLSMSTFYSSFKKVEGTTPAAWRQALMLAAES